MNLVSIIKKIIEPKQVDENKQRRELVLNIILFFSLTGFLIINIIRIIDNLIYSEEKGIPLYITLIIFLFFGFLLFLSKKGQLKIASFLLITTFSLPMFYSLIAWGTDLPAALLLAVLVITLSGILFGESAALISTLIISAFLIILTDQQSKGLLKIEDYWRNEPAQIGDAISHGVLLFIIAGITWLFIKEINKSLKRAILSERLLKDERDQLEVKVETRTKELLDLEADKVKQIYRLAEFGRLSSGIFHDLINPLSAVALNLEQIKSETDSKILNAKSYLGQALLATNKMESLIASIKKQIARENVVELFSINQEIEQAIQILTYKAKRAQTEIFYDNSKVISINGDPLKFSQVIINLLANGIDACEEVDIKKISVNIKEGETGVEIIIRDSGIGISKENLEKIFLPFFSTKKTSGRGFGIGLATSKEIIEKDFSGSISVSSQENLGSSFIIKFAK